MVYETTEAYDGSGKFRHLKLDKGCQVNVLEKNGTDWLVRTTMGETCNGELEMEGIVPMNILRPISRKGEDYLLLHMYIKLSIACS